MTMMGQSRASNRSQGANLLAGFVLFLVIVLGTSFKDHIRGFFAEYILPLKDAGQYAGLSKSELVTKLTALQAELNSARYKSTIYDLVAEENTKLKSAASLESFAKVIPARVLSRPPQTHYDSLILDRGTDSGIKENDTVAVEGFVLGKVVSVSHSSSVVQLYSTAGVTRDVILGTPSAVAVLSGLGGGSFSVSLPRSVTVDLGEAVRIPNSQTLSLGTVVSIKGEATDASQVVYVASPVSIQGLDFVSVIPSQ